MRKTFLLLVLPGVISAAAPAAVEELSVGGIAQDIDWGLDEIRFSFRPGPGPVSIRIDSVDPAPPCLCRPSSRGASAARLPSSCAR